MEKRIIKLIESLNRIMTSWKFLVIRRTLINLFSIIIFSQLVIITIFWILGREITTSLVELIGIEFGAWTIMVSFYFKERYYKNEEEKEVRKNKRVFKEENENNRE